MVKLPTVQKLCQQHFCQNRQFAIRYPVNIVLKKSMTGKSFKMELKNLQNDTFRAWKNSLFAEEKGKRRKKEFLQPPKKWSNYLLLKSYVNNTPVKTAIYNRFTAQHVYPHWDLVNNWILKHAVCLNCLSQIWPRKQKLGAAAVIAWVLMRRRRVLRRRAVAW